MLAYAPYLNGLGINMHVLAFASLVALLSALSFAVTPLLLTQNHDPHSEMAKGGRWSADLSWRRLGSKLVIVEFATAVVLLIGAGLLAKSLYLLLHVGVQPGHLSAITVAAVDVVGLYGVAAYSASQRRREIGVRMALGAEKRAVYWLLLSEAGWLIGFGIAACVLASLGVSKILQQALFNVRPWDGATLAGVSALLALAALLAAFAPARRAAQVNPWRRCEPSDRKGAGGPGPRLLFAKRQHMGSNREALRAGRYPAMVAAKASASRKRNWEAW